MVLHFLEGQVLSLLKPKDQCFWSLLVLCQSHILVINRLGILTPNHSDDQCLPISVRKEINERAHVQTSARTVNRGRNAKTDDQSVMLLTLSVQNIAHNYEYF